MAAMGAGERTAVADEAERADEGATVAEPVQSDAGRQSAVSGRNGADEPAAARASANHGAYQGVDHGADQGAGGARARQQVAAAGAEEDERRDDGLSFWQHMVAGSVAGMVEHMAMFPVDTIKTRMQALATPGPPVPPAPSAPSAGFSALPSASPSALSSFSSLSASRSVPAATSCAFQSTCSVANPAAAAAQSLSHSPTIRNAVSSILKTEGAAGLYRGIAAMGLGAGPAHAVYFAVYEAAKESLLRNSSSSSSNVSDGLGFTPALGVSLPPAVAHATAGALATVASDAVLTPMDVVKQRLQLRRSPYAGVVDCCRKMLQEEGIYSFYRSYRTTLVMNVPFTAVHFATYEASKAGLGRALPGEALPGEGVLDEDRLLTHVLAGGAAGALASAITNPLDVVKTRLQCQGVCGVKRLQSASVTAALSSIVREEGWGTLLRGMRARMLFHTPAAAIVWSTYEASKNLLRDIVVREEGWGALLQGMRACVLFHTPAAAIVWSTYEASKNLLRDLLTRRMAVLPACLLLQFVKFSC
ncbi:unnamed protein product [Closterium sp. Naga37s-1]|nr:unnamed protein product [Closterium sp. Naga37s-1]